MKRPTLEDIIMLHDEIVAQSGGLLGASNFTQHLKKRRLI